MALIKIDSVSVTEAEKNALKQNYLYKDLFLDIKNRVSFNRQLNRKEELKDVQGLFDIESIQNSIANALLTSPGQKILNPEFGIDLRRFIFEPVSPFTQLEIQTDIEERLPGLEPRIELENVEVSANEDQQEYNITLQINVPSLNVYGLSLRSVLNSNGYNFV
jgi:phage baseplate assembly protein W|tara:strand:+ start:431 stop:919 length:489 start_codon:yes stop_codon:yes gene_type:complete